MRTPTAMSAYGVGLLLLGSSAPVPLSAEPERPPMVQMVAMTVAAVVVNPPAPPPPPEPPPPPPPPPPPTPQEALADGVMIVVSIPEQQMFVFRNGALWETSPVSTGRRGHETPTGTFNILQKRVMHRSNLYNNAPMPFMQRLTWDGIALHAGHVPGRPASHGCVRLPRAFAEKLYRITGHQSTAVVITDEAVDTPEEALAISREAPAAAVTA